MESLGGYVNCPVCRDITKVVEKQEEAGEKTVFDKLRIPPAYTGFGTAGKDLLTIQNLGGFSQNSISEVGSLLERINKDIYNERVTNLSVYIYTSNLVDIKRFVYGAQKLALEKGLGVTPYISANTLYGIQRVGDYNLRSLKEATKDGHDLKDINPDLIHAVEGYRIVQETQLTYFDFIHADVCFIEATANTTEKGWTGIADLLGERSKQGLPTYVIGYWGTKGSAMASKGLRYLLAPENGLVRLDLLVPYELKSRRGEDDVHVARNIQMDSTTSTVSAGLSIKTIMEA